MKNIFRIALILFVISWSSCKDDEVWMDSPDYSANYFITGFIQVDGLLAQPREFYLDEERRLCNFWDSLPRKNSECILFSMSGRQYEAFPMDNEQPYIPFGYFKRGTPYGVLSFNYVLGDTLMNIRVMTNEDTGLGLAVDRDVTSEFDVLYDDPMRVMLSGFKDYDGPDAYKDVVDPERHGPYAFIRTSLERFNETVHPYNSVSMALLPKAESNLDKARSLTIIATLGTYKSGRKQFSCVYNAQASTD